MHKKLIALAVAFILCASGIIYAQTRLKGHGATASITSAGAIALVPASGQAVAITGPATISTTLGVTGNVAVNTNKFNVTAASGNTTVAGTLGVSGASTLAGVTVTGRNVPYSTKTVLTPAAAVAIDSTLGNFFTLVPDQATAINATTVGVSGQTLFIKILTSGTSSFVITFGTNFKSTGTLATGTADAKIFMVQFLSDGTNYIEVARTAAQ
jgi:hypothetical protein